MANANSLHWLGIVAEKTRDNGSMMVAAIRRALLLDSANLWIGKRMS